MTLAIGNIMKGWKVPPPPKREPDWWRNVYQGQDGRQSVGLAHSRAEFAAEAGYYGSGHGAIYRLRIYLKKEPTQ